MKYPDFIEELLLAKAYTDLTADEKQQVGEWLTNEEEYTKIRELLVGIESAFSKEEEEQVPAHIKTTLEQAFTKKYKAKRLLTMRWQLVATLSIAASLALVFYIGSLFNQQQKPTEVAINTPKKEEVKTTPKENANKEIAQLKAATESNIEEANELQKKELPPLPPLASIDENLIMDDDLEIAEGDDKVSRGKYRDVAKVIENENATVAVEEVIVQKKIQKSASPPTQRVPKKITEITTDEIQALPQRNDAYFTSPSVPAGTYDVEVFKIDNRFILGSSSLADNTDLLDLGVEVY